MSNNDPGTRLHALDAVRAIALMLGIALHSALSYMPGIDPQLWPLKDGQQSLSMSLGVFLIHIFRMSVFFLVAGLFAHMLFHRRGAVAFLRNRAARILVPLVLGWVVCFLCIAGVVVWSLVRANGGQWPASPPASGKLSFLHLWFLYILCWLYPGVLMLRRLVHAVDRNNVSTRVADRILRHLSAAPFRSLLLAAPISLALFLEPGWVWWFGVPTPGYTWMPPAVPLFIYGYVFGLGWLLDRQHALLDQLARRWWLRAWTGAVAAGLCLAMAGLEASYSTVRDPAIKLAYAIAYGIALVSWTLAFIGCGVRFLGRSTPLLRYLSDASYWMYVAHLPVVMALQAWMMPFPWPGLVKFATVTLVTCASLLLIYGRWVRPSWVGLLLNGRKYPRAAEPAVAVSGSDG
ncbi:acyltransferase family protein [Caldimonas brevitalea]|uniref:Glucans biosynthesis protein C n=1 Tax=Caldimonas brevitalea TaxID=413882 RepID=A0A0G3BZD2_9BURK|nr:acyltransferase family protein [Caldimonas brevitalea]AKJ31880.1 glucans biosynthesis protein C [Caldimonas brevitalea]